MDEQRAAVIRMNRMILQKTPLDSSLQTLYAELQSVFPVNSIDGTM